MAKPSATSNPQPGPDGVELGVAVALGSGLPVGVAVGVSSPTGTTRALPRSRTLE
jgi:hypothetical protein